ncbi:MAG TPA: hypothetical protein VHE81_12325 [Lacipirellulaceae bacterium]|nr:hypothetical protein [Lacipirellulaceae bacterium]
MKRNNRSKGRRSGAAVKIASPGIGPAVIRARQRWLVIAIAALGTWTLLAVRGRTQQADSGWAIATPSPLAKGSASANLQQQLVIRRLLDQTQQPLLRKTPPSPANSDKQATADQSRSNIHLAERPNGSAAVGNWRPAVRTKQQLEEEFSARLAAPLDETPSVATKSAGETEADCRGPQKGGGIGSAPAPFLIPAQTPESAASDAPVPKAHIEARVQERSAEASATEESSDDAADDELTPAESSETRRDARVESRSKTATADPPPKFETNGRSQVASSGPTATPPSPDAAPEKELPPLSRQMYFLRTRVRAVLAGYYRKAMNSRDNDPWQVMHGMLAYGINSRIHAGGPNGELITAVGWLCYNKPCKGQTLLYVTPSGELRAKYGVGLQGHLGQFLAMLAQCNVSPDYPIHVGDHEFTIHDLIEAEKKTCYPKSELTFKLIALQHYADLNDRWVNDQGLEWDFPRLVREELEQPIRGAACGGTHRLSGLSLTVQTRLRRGEPLDGEYERAADFVKRYQMYAFRLQNPDGSLSTAWFQGRGDDDDINRRIKTTGHILEWLCYSLSDEELREPNTIRAVAYLANLMYFNYDNQWEAGAMWHATHALFLYNQRVFVPYDKEGEVAGDRPAPSTARRNQSRTNGSRR